MEGLGQHIKKFRELKNITREYIAEELGMTVGGYSKIERNETDLKFSKIKKIAEILEVDISEILNFDLTRFLNKNEHIHMDIHDKSKSKGNLENIYREKYIKMLESENKILKELLKNKMD
jgi:transcriptional regulator with XRE-family HTH domain